MTNPEPNFLKSIKFEKDFHPFKEWTEINFWWEEEVQRMIEFYLKNQKVENYKKNSERFKINCVLGNNWGGKSRLFEWILQKEDILYYTAERKNKDWSFYDLWVFFQKTHSYYFNNIDHSLNICKTKNQQVLTDLSSREDIEKTLSSLLEIDLKDWDINELIQRDKVNKIQNTVNENDYLKNIWDNYQEIMKFSNILDEKWKVIEFTFLLDDFFKLSWNIHNSVNKELLYKENLNEFYCDVHNFLIRENKIKAIYSKYLNLENKYQSSLNLLHNSGNWTNELCRLFWWEYISFSEEKYNEDRKGDIYFLLNSTHWTQILDLFHFLYLKLNNKPITEYSNLNEMYTNEDCENIWFALSDFFIALINNLSNNLMDFTTSSSNLDFVWYKWYIDFKKGLILLEFFLKLIEKNNLHETHFKEEYTKDELRDFQIYKTNPLYLNDWDNLCKNTSHILHIFNLLEEKEEKKAEKYLKENLNWLSLNKLLMRTSGYEKNRATNASDYYILEILSGFSWKWKDINTAYGLQFRNFIYYWIRSHYSQKIDDNKNFLITNKLLSKKEKHILSFPFFKLDLIFKDLNLNKSFNNLSAWEKTTLTRFTNISRNIFESTKTDFLILIDEPDLHLHLDWQRQYIQKLIDVFSTLDSEINLHFIIATHSPFIISDLPTECMVVLDKSEKNRHKGEFVEVKEYSEKDEKGKFLHQTFGANYIDIIKSGFFFEDKQMLMGSFAKNIIWDIAENERKHITNWDKKNTKWQDIKKNIWDDFLKDNLLYFKPEKND